MGKNKTDMCREFGLINSMIQTTWKNGTKIISVFKENGSRVKQFWKPEQSNVNEALLLWFKQERSDCTSGQSSSHGNFVL
jgi:hypothetical protein